MKSFDVLVVGAGPAGLQAAMMLARANRTVLLCDDGRPRNIRAQAMHYFPSRDGSKPTEFREAFHRDLAHYPHVLFKSTRVLDINRQEKGFVAQLTSETIFARKIILGSGVEDVMPPIPNVSNFYGRTIFHCPYCHGYEFKDKRIGVMANNEVAWMMTSILYNISRKLTVFTNGPADFTVSQRKIFEKKGVPIVENKVLSFLGEGDQLRELELDGSQPYALDGLLLRPEQRSRSPLAESLGCEKNDLGLFKVDGETRSSVPSVFLAGDLMDMRQSVLTSAYFGMISGVSANHELNQEDWIF